MIPRYIGEYLKAYFEVSSEDRRALLSDSFFEFDPMECKEEYLAFLASECGVSVGGLNDKELKEQIKATPLKKGTAKFLKNSCESFFEGVGIEEKQNRWRESDFRFSLKTVLKKGQIYSKEKFETIFRVVENSKNVRSVFEGIKIEQEAKEQIKTSNVAFWDVELSKELKTDFIFNDKTKLTGVIIWQV